MKITKTQLRQIIQEELEAVIAESMQDYADAAERGAARGKALGTQFAQAFDAPGLATAGQRAGATAGMAGQALQDVAGGIKPGTPRALANVLAKRAYQGARQGNARIGPGGIIPGAVAGVTAGTARDLGYLAGLQDYPDDTLDSARKYGLVPRARAAAPATSKFGPEVSFEKEYEELDSDALTPEFDIRRSSRS